LERNLDGEIGRFANFQEGVLGSNFAVFGKIAACLAHHPNRQARYTFAAAGSQKEFFAGQCGGLIGHIDIQGG
jgi:hypothetical protein